MSDIFGDLDGTPGSPFHGNNSVLVQTIPGAREQNDAHSFLRAAEDMDASLPVPKLQVRKRTGKVFGPLDPTQIIAMIASGELLGSEEASADGVSWRPLAQTPTFAAEIHRQSTAALSNIPRVATPAPRAPEAPKPASNHRRRNLIIAGAAAAAIAAAAVVPAAAGQGVFASALWMPSDNELPTTPGANGKQGDGKGDGTKGDGKGAPQSPLAPAVVVAPGEPTELMARDTFANYLQVVASGKDGELRGRALAVLSVVERSAAATDELRKAPAGTKGLGAALGAAAIRYADGKVDAGLALLQPFTDPASSPNADDAALAHVMMAMGQSEKGAAADALKSVELSLQQRMTTLGMWTHAKLLADNGAPAEAMERLAKIDGQHPRSQWLRAQLVSQQANRQDEARAELLRLTEGEGAPLLSPVQQASLFAVRGELALRAGNLPDATRFANRAAELAGNDRVASLRCLELTLSAAQFDAAAGLARGLLARNAKDEVAIVGLARAKLGNRDLLGAYTDVQGALAAAPDSPTLSFWLGVVAKAMGKRDESKTLFQKSRILDPKAHDPAVELAMDAVEHGKYQEATTIAEEAAAAVPVAERWRMVGVKAHVLTRKRAFAAADEGYQEALRARPSAAGIRAQYVEMLVAAGRLADAEQQLGEAQLLDPKNPTVLLAAGVVASARGNDAQALERATEAMQLAPSWYLPFARAARAAAKLKDGARARGYVEIADRLLHGSPDVLAAQAAVALSNDPKTAVSLMQEAQEAAPDDPNITYELGKAHTEAGNFLDAIEVLKKVTKTVPDFGDAYFALAKVNREIGRSGDAHRTLEQMLKADPKRIDAWLETADLYASADNDAAALKAYQKAQDVDPNHAATACALGEALVVRMGDDERNLKRGVEVLRRCVELAPKEPAGWKHMGNAYLSLRKGKDAVAAFQTYLDLADPADPERVAVQESLANLKQPGG